MIHGLAFTLTCVPPTANHQRKRIVKIGKFSRLADKPELNAAKAMLDELLLLHQPSAPVSGIVAVTLTFTWPWLAKHSQRVRALGRVPHTSKPDLTNVAKTFEDRLVALRFIDDDRAVQRLTLEKWWGDQPGINVVIRPFVPESERRR